MEALSGRERSIREVNRLNQTKIPNLEVRCMLKTRVKK